jgi:hypothetical protein
MNNQEPKPLSYWLSYWAAYDSSRGVTRAVAKTMQEMISPRQMTAIRAIGHSQRIDTEAECQRLFRCKIEETNSKAASTFITYLKLDTEERAKAA